MKPAAKLSAFAIQTGIFSACAAPVISGTYVYFLWGFGPAHPAGHIYDIPGGIIVGSAEAFIPASCYGFVCGTIGGALLYFAARSMRSLLLLTLASAGIGAVLSLLFPFVIISLLGFWSKFDPSLNWGWFTFPVAVGVPVSILYVIVFRRRLVALGFAEK